MPCLKLWGPRLLILRIPSCCSMCCSLVPSLCWMIFDLFDGGVYLPILLWVRRHRDRLLIPLRTSRGNSCKVLVMTCCSCIINLIIQARTVSAEIPSSSSSSTSLLLKIYDRYCLYLTGSLWVCFLWKVTHSVLSVFTFYVICPAPHSLLWIVTCKYSTMWERMRRAAYLD